MQRNGIVIVVILSIVSSTTMVGCSVTDILAGSSNPLFGIALIPIQMIGALLLDQLLGPLLGDPAGDLGGNSASTVGVGDQPVDD